MKLNSYVNVNNIIIYIYKLKIILFNFMIFIFFLNHKISYILIKIQDYK